MNNKLKDKLLKLLELAKRGVDGEKTSAERMLQKMLDKHDLTLDDIDAELPKIRVYFYTTIISSTIIKQIMYRVTERSNIYRRASDKCLYAEVTDYEHVQILEMIDFHLDNFNKERKEFLETFTDAYVQKHRLFKLSPDDDAPPPEPLSNKERARIWKMAAIKDTLSNNTYTKKLKS